MGVGTGELSKGPRYESESSSNWRTKHLGSWLAIYIWVAATVGCVATGWYFGRQNAKALGMEAAIGVMRDPDEPDHARCAAAVRIYYLTRMAVETFEECTTLEAQVGRDSVAYLSKLRKHLGAK